MNRDHKLVLPCNCGCSILVLETWDVGEPEAEWFAEMFKRPGKAHWRWRLKTAIGLLFGKEPVFDDLCFGTAEIVLLRDFLNDCYPSVNQAGNDSRARANQA